MDVAQIPRSLYKHWHQLLLPQSVWFTVLSVVNTQEIVEWATDSIPQWQLFLGQPVQAYRD